MNTESTYFLTINGKKQMGELPVHPVINPATGKTFAPCPSASIDQADHAVIAANKAFEGWSEFSLKERSEVLKKVAQTIEEHTEELAHIITHEQGKPINLARTEVAASVYWTNYIADQDIPVKLIEDSDDRHVELHRHPIGVVLAITPWNWPLMIAIWQIMPALKAGNTVVVKPSPYTPLNTLKLVELLQQVLPEGVLNAVTGDQIIGEHLTHHDLIDKVTFTGSTATGKKIVSASANNLKRITLELGGNDPGIILPGTNIDKIADKLFMGAFLNMGQTCAALKRLYVHTSQYENVVTQLSQIAASQVMGPGINPEVTFGPIQNQAQLDYVSELINDAREQGARIISGAFYADPEGYFHPPTIVAGLTNGHRLVDEEQFGPVLPIIAYDSLEEAIHMANDTETGLGASVWGEDLALAQNTAMKIKAGTVWINDHGEVLPHCPFGGAKNSGTGVSFGEEGLLEYTQVQLVNIKKIGG